MIILGEKNNLSQKEEVKYLNYLKIYLECCEIFCIIFIFIWWLSKLLPLQEVPADSLRVALA